MFAQVMSVFDNLDKKQLISLSIISIVVIVALVITYISRTKTENFADEIDCINENEEFADNSECTVKFFFADYVGIVKELNHFKKFMEQNSKV